MSPRELSSHEEPEQKLTDRDHPGKSPANSKRKTIKPPHLKAQQRKTKSLFKDTVSTKVKKQEKFAINLDELGNGWNRNAPSLRSFRGQHQGQSSLNSRNTVEKEQ